MRREARDALAKVKPINEVDGESGVEDTDGYVTIDEEGEVQS